MKNLKLEITLSEYQEKHVIYLGNNENLKHQNKTFLKTYLRTYKKVLKDNIRQLNLFNSQLYQLYRIFFFDLSEIEVSKITSCFNDFNRSFNWMFDNIGGDQNSIIFSKMSNCIRVQFDILFFLKEHGQIHKNYSLKNQSEALLKSLSDFEHVFDKNKISLDLNRNYTRRNLKVIKQQLKKDAC